MLTTTFAHAKALTIYSGRSERLIGPILKQFEKDSGIKLNVRYGKTPQLAAAIMEEEKNSPADLFFSQDAGALGVLATEGLSQIIDSELLSKVDSRFISSEGLWIGITGRARTVDYNTVLVNPVDLPKTIWGFIDKRWANGRIGWAPSNSSFQSFVAGFLALEGEEKTREWLRAIQSNKPQVYPNNTAIVAALGRGEIEVGFVNNYYLQRFLKTNVQFPVAHHYTRGDAGSMMNVAGIAILKTSKKKTEVNALIAFLLSDQVQLRFATETFEYPLVKTVTVQGSQKSLKEVPSPKMDLSDLKGIRKAVKILQEESVL